MRIRDTFRFSFANLVQRKLRSALTMVGVAVGTGAIVIMVSLAQGLRNEFVKLLESGDSLQTLQVIPMKMDLNFNPHRHDRKYRIYKDADIEQLGKVEGVLAVWPDLQLFPVCERDKRGEATAILPIPREAVTSAMRDSVVAGEWLRGDGAEAVVPLRFLRKRPPPGSAEDEKPKDPTPAEAAAAVGTTLSLVFARKDPVIQPGLVVEGPDEKGRRRVTCRICGVYDPKKIGGLDRGVWVPLAFGKSLQGLADAQIAIGPEGGPTMLKVGEYSMLHVRAVSIAEMPAVKERIEAMDYPTVTVQDVVSMLDKVTFVLQAALSCIGGIALLVAFFGIVNTMVMAILERTREIGMLKALGARNRDIRRLFVLEAAGIGLGGALVGLGGGWLAGLALNAIAFHVYLKEKGFDELNLFQISRLLAAGSVAFAVLVASAAGLYPAIRASRLDPVTALRHE